VLGVLFDAAWGGEAGTKHRRAALAAAAVVVLLYAVPLYWSVREWNVMAAVSQKVVHDVQRAAMAAPESSLVIVGPPVRSWEWALPFAVRPPFAQKDLTTRAFIISPRAISCCSPQWFDDTRRALEHWSAGASRESVVALSWHPDTGALSSATSEDTPELPALVRALLDMNNPEDLDRNLRRMLGVLTR
jgi:hypothetical protein